MDQELSFDVTLVKDCARAFSTVSHLGASVVLTSGQIPAAYGGCNCKNCQLCHLMGRPETLCFHIQLYNMGEAERFGGRYIYLCPLGLTCFVTPIIGETGSEAAITAGPFLMVDPQDFLRNDLLPFLPDKSSLPLVAEELARIPVVSAAQVEDMSHLLFLSASFLNKLCVSRHMMDIQESYSIQGQISAHIGALKKENIGSYPFQTENDLLYSISHLDREGAGRHLNELLGYIFFSMGGHLQLAKSRICELLVLISRTAVTAGADAQDMLMLTHECIQTIPNISSIDMLCTWLTKAVNHFMDGLFEFVDVKHANVIHQAVRYIRAHYAEKMSLDDVARVVYLSPAYFSRIFCRETGQSFNTYLNAVRVEKSKGLLLDKSVRLIDVALAVGFDSQSYFTKVFKKNTGLTPLQYRERLCKELPPV